MDCSPSPVQHACDDKPKICQYIKKYVAQNVDWTTQAADKYKTAAPYWHQVNLFISQFEGLFNGFHKAANGSVASRLTWDDLLYAVHNLNSKVILFSSKFLRIY